MKFKLTWIIWNFASLIICCTAQAQGLTKYVQPMAGTAAATTASALKHSGTDFALFANTIPAVTTPFAMTQWTPQTQTTENKCTPPYFYKDTLLRHQRVALVKRFMHAGLWQLYHHAHYR